MIEIISDKTREQIEELFERAESCVQIVSPFLSVKTAEMLGKICKEKNIKKHIKSYKRIVVLYPVQCMVQKEKQQVLS